MLRNKYAAISSKELIWAEHTAEKNVVAFYRSDERDSFFVMVNLTDQQVTFEVKNIPHNLHLIKDIVVSNTVYSFEKSEMKVSMLEFGYFIGQYL